MNAGMFNSCFTWPCQVHPLAFCGSGREYSAMAHLSPPNHYRSCSVLSFRL